MCHKYSNALNELILTKECLITRSYSLNIILKLRSDDAASFFISYHALRDHMIIIS